MRKIIITTLFIGLSVTFCIVAFAQGSKAGANSLPKEKLEEITRRCVGGGHWSIVKCIELETNRELIQLGQQPIVPEPTQEITSANIKYKGSIAANLESIREGEKVYWEYCFVCHGDQGKGDGPAAEFSKKPVPDLTSQITQNQKDNAIFTKITAGSTPMPPFGNFMSKEDVENIINYLRTFSKDSKSSPSS